MINIEKLNANYCSKIIVPKGIRYLSDWKEFGLFPYPHILDKKIPGCGFTEFCLTNDQDLVLCSPRKILLEDKFKQHKNDVFYVINSYEKIVGVDKEINKDSRSRAAFERDNEIDTPEIKKKKSEYYNTLKSQIEAYILSRYRIGLPFKIIVTYDSFYLVKRILSELDCTKVKFAFNKIQVVIDEMQSLFVDAAFKASTENSLLEELKSIEPVCYVSATPMIESYLRQVDNFTKMPYFEFDWELDDPGRVSVPKLIVKKLTSITTNAKEIVGKYLSGNFESKFVKDEESGEVNKIESKEAVFFMNSVNNILNVIKACNLKPDQVNILCADTPENNRRLRRKLGKKFSIGEVPLKGDPHKMFTFCTRTVYLGADFYSTCARTFVLSDANIQTLAVDISLDLPQILGRQRLDENPWRNEAEFYYKTICDGNVNTEEEFNKHIKKKLKVTDNLLLSYDSSPTDDSKQDLAVKYEYGIHIENYKHDYVAVNKVGLNVDGDEYLKRPTINKILVIAERRAFDIQQIDYANRFSVFSRIDDKFNVSNLDNEVIVKFFEVYEGLPNLYQKLKYLCEYPVDEGTRLNILDQVKEKHFKEYYLALGPEKLKSLGYTLGRIKDKLNILTFDQSKLEKDIYKTFVIGKRYSNKEIKSMLKVLYDNNGYEKTPVAKDILNYFEAKEVRYLDDKLNKWVHGFEIIKRK